MSLFRKKAAETPKKVQAPEEPVAKEKALTKVITAEGWHRKVLGKPTEIVLKKRG